MTSKNKPSVKIDIGIVRKTKIGFTTELRNAKTTATKIAVPKLLSTMVTPGSKYALTNTANVEINILRRNFMTANFETSDCVVLNAKFCPRNF